MVYNLALLRCLLPAFSPLPHQTTLNKSHCIVLISLALDLSWVDAALRFGRWSSLDFPFESGLTTRLSVAWHVEADTSPPSLSRQQAAAPESGHKEVLHAVRSG